MPIVSEPLLISQSCRLPSMGIALLLATFGFGADRLYVGHYGLGAVLLLAYLSVFGLLIAGPVEWLSALSLVIAILQDRRTAFMYGGYTLFAPITTFDKVLAVIWIMLMVFGVGIMITSALMIHRR